MTYLEEDGFLVIEVEDRELQGDWELHTDANGYLGLGYIEWRGANHFALASAGQGVMSYRFHIQSAGNYELRLRSKINQGESGTEHNDSWLRLATGSNITNEYPLSGWIKAYTNQTGNWGWQTRTKDHDGQSIRQYFDNGYHKLELSGRSTGHAIDRLVLYRYEENAFAQGKFDNLAVSTTISDTVTTTGGDSGGGSSAGDTDDGSLPDGTGHTTDVNNPDGAGQVNAVRMNEAQWAASVCEDERLTLLPLMDSTATGDAYVDSDLHLLAPGESRALFRFDLRAVSGFQLAELQYALGEKTGSGIMSFWLLAHEDWPGDIGREFAPPANTVLLGWAIGAWEAGSTYASQLDPALLQSDVLSIGMQLDSGAEIAIAALEHPDLPPLRLQLIGHTGFCTAYNQTVVEIESVETIEDAENTGADTDAVDLVAGRTDGDGDGITSREDALDAESMHAPGSGIVGWPLAAVLLLFGSYRLAFRHQSR